MKRIIPISLWLLMLTATFACSDHEPIRPQEHIETTSTVTYRTLEEALEAADEWFAQMEMPTRSNGRKVKSVECLHSGSSTRSNAADTLLYLVNYEDEQGFALLGAPAGSKQIYAISEEGRLLMSDTVDIKPLAMFLNNARQDAQNSISINPPIDPTPYGSRIVRKVEPMLPDNVANWSQYYPYNQKCPIIDNTYGVTGCVPLAVGMLLSYYQFPDSITAKKDIYSSKPNLSTPNSNDSTEQKKILWNLILVENNKVAISKLLDDLAAPWYLNSSYMDPINHKLVWNNRITSLSRISKTIAKLGFALGDAWEYTALVDHLDEALDFMQNGYEGYIAAAPIILSGAEVPKDSSSTHTTHTWITDGYIQRERYLLNFPNLPGFKEDPSLHMVWGWGGKANGYYLFLSSSGKHTAIADEDAEPDMPQQFWGIMMFGRYAIFN